MKPGKTPSIICFAVMFLLGVHSVYGDEIPPGLIGKEAPVFEGKDIDAKPVTLADLRKGNAVVLINFWGLRCGACVQEIPHLNGIYARYAKSGLNILGVNVDGLAGPKIKAQMESSGIRIDYPWIPDTEFKIIDAFKMAGAPLNVLIDRFGKITYYHEGYFEGDELKIEAEIGKALLTHASGK